MNPARRSPLVAIVLALGLLCAAIVPVPVAAARTEAPSQRWVVAVSRAGGSAIGPRGVLGPLPRLRAIPGDPAARRAVSRIIRTVGLRPTAVYRRAFNGFAASLTPAQVSALRRDPAVAVLMPDRATRVEATPASGGVVRIRLTSPVTPTGIRRVNADQGPLSRIDGRNDALDVDVAIIDTGIAPSPELRIAGGFDCSSDDPAAWRDREGHGTHVAGTIAARDDGKGVVGVAPGARLWAIKIFDDQGSGFSSQELCGFDTVLGMRDPQDPSRPLVEVINLSIGQWLAGFDDRDCGRQSGDLIHGSICALVADGVTVVAAAGNQSVSTVTRQPAAYDEVITVSALADFDGLPGGVGKQKDVCPTYSPDNDDTFGDFSNFGPDVDIIAPGKCILSTLPRGWYGHSTGTSMATPHVTGAAALIAATYPGATPGQIRAALLGAATKDWKWRTDPDGTPDRLLDISRLGALPDLALVASDASDELARGGVTRIDVTIERRGGHTGLVDVRATDLPDGLTADVAPSPTRGGTVAVWVRAATDAPAGPQQLTIRATDGDLVRTTTATVQVRSGGPTIVFSVPEGGADGLRITDGDQVTVTFAEDAPGAPPAERRVLHQAGAVVTPGTCDGVDWAAVGDAVTPGELDPGGSAGTGWSFSADLTADGCSRWLVRLIDEEGHAARFTTPAVLRDTTDPLLPRVRAQGDGVWQSGSANTVWVRGGMGSLTLTADGRDAASGVASHGFGPLSDPTGWTSTPTPAGPTSQTILEWGPSAEPTDLRIRATDATGRTGPARTISLKVDGSAPRANGWLSPASGTSAVSGEVPELGWRSITDVGSGPALLQRIQRQVARPVGDSCRGVAWVDDGLARMLAPHDEQWDVRSGWCQRWILYPLDNVGNVGRRSISGVLSIDVTAPAADFRTPDEGSETVIAGSRLSVAWKERRQAGGGTTSRTLERERVRAQDGICPTQGWRIDGRIDRGASPSVQSGLKADHCYRWRLNLLDSRDNASVELSGTVRLLPAP